MRGSNELIYVKRLESACYLVNTISKISVIYLVATKSRKDQVAVPLGPLFLVVCPDCPCRPLAVR